MLVLSRKEGERIIIGNDIHLTITQIKGNRVAIGIEAPREVSIRRSELSITTDFEYQDKSHDKSHDSSSESQPQTKVA